MIENEKFKQAYNIIENIEVNTRVRQIQNNREKLEAYWQLGKIIYDTQGEKRAKYGNNLLKEWSAKLTTDFGKFYGITNLKNMRQFYLLFQKGRSMRDQSLKDDLEPVLINELTWTHYRYILPIKNENERNYYINQVILNSLTSRELINLIKSKAFDRLSLADKENIKLIENNNYNLKLEDMIKDPILLKSNKNITNLNEKIIHKLVIELVEERFLELGTGFALIGHEYKINIGNRYYKIDLLFFNLELNSYVVVEIKTKENKAKDIGQLELYVEYINKHLKKPCYAKTIGMLLVQKENKILVEYITKPNIFITSYEIISSL